MGKNPKKKDDPFEKLMYRGYCRSQLPPEDVTFKDLVNSAKSFLCQKTHTLFKDSIWEKYTDEEILVEYYSWLFEVDDDARKKFQVKMDMGSSIYGEEIYDWLDRKVEENQEEIKKKLEEMPDRISFSPNDGTDIEE